MSTAGKILITSEILLYGFSLNFGEASPFSTVKGALIALGIVAATWAGDQIACYVWRELRRRK